MPQQRSIALVTGASSGIGAEFARELARRGYDLVLTARRRDRLELLRDELQARCGVGVTLVPCDLAERDAAERLFQEVVVERGLDVALLINNAGFGIYGPVTQTDPRQLQAILDVNVSALTALARCFGACMEQRGRGWILNVASYAALQPIPRYAVYSGTKAYVLGFSQALRRELLPRGVVVSVLAPGFTSTEFHSVARHERTFLMRLTSMEARAVARAGIRGLLRGKFLIVPGLWYKANALAVRVLPRGVASALSGWMVRD